MAEGFTLKADVRERTGKGAARALRRGDQIPAVIYGNNEPPEAIAIPRKEVTLALYGGGFRTNLWQIDVGGRTVQALARDYQRDPVGEKLMHVDFLRVTARSRVTVNVPVSFVGEDQCVGLRDGGVLNIVAHTVSVEAGATTIPEAIEVSLAGLEIGATITSEDLTLPPDVTFTNDEAFPIATIATPVEDVPDEEPEAPGDVPAIEVAEGDEVTGGDGAGGGEGEGSAEGDEAS
ncbi:50S ribosomal protein L25/general stress protein Ctc [Acuticoccus sp.]|uniref:50S ribosomal protein L25/general stress protein Ctc n=1 Tax=Acuticoccus sp. TaxID=1904378 RepID=UPI003B51BDFB